MLLRAVRLKPKKSEWGKMGKLNKQLFKNCQNLNKTTEMVQKGVMYLKNEKKYQKHTKM